MKELGEFVLERPLGKGATAQVFLAYSKRDPQQKRLALKVFHPALWHQEELRRRAQAEIQAISALDHPNIVRLIKPFWDLEPPAVALEFVDGGSLEEFQARLPYIVPEIAVLVLMEVLNALEHAHGLGVIHRDLKPANILIGNDGRVLVSDFGLAKISDVSRMTASGTILGSPDFMSPEQARGEVATPASDVFSCSAILYYLVTGTRPFTRHSPLATLAAVIEGQPEPPQLRNPKLSPALARLIQRGLSRSPEKRFSSAQEFKQELDAYLVQIGLSEQSFSFARWIASPSEVALFAMKTKAQALIQAAEQTLVERDWDRFLEETSHLSAVAPESSALPRLMEQYDLRRKQSRRRAGLIPLLFALLLLAGGGAFRYAKSKPPQEVQAPPKASRTAPLTVASAPIARSVEPESAGEPRRTVPPAPISPIGGSAEVDRVAMRKRLGRVKFDVPHDVRVFWDGILVDPEEGLAPQKVGLHQIRLERDGRLPINQKVAVRSNEPTVIRVR